MQKYYFIFKIDTNKWCKLFVSFVNYKLTRIMDNLYKTDIGLIGLAVMGENLALNMAGKGWNVSVYNRTVLGVEEGVVERFVNGRAKGKSIQGHTDIADFVASIAAPRKIMMMVRAGSAVDELMDQLFPHLSAGDILIDGGNSNFEDTNRRVELAEKKGFRFVGAGVSGGHVAVGADTISRCGEYPERLLHAIASHVRLFLGDAQFIGQALTDNLLRPHSRFTQ